MKKRHLLLSLISALLLAGCGGSQQEEDAPETPEAMYAKAQELLSPSVDRDGPDTKGAVKWLVRAAHAGHRQAQVDLGGIYYKGGKGIGEDPRKALEWFTRAAEQGDTGSLIFIGEIYYTGNGVERDAAKGLECWRKALDAGVAEAHFYLGSALLTAKRETVEEGVEHLKKAATTIKSGLAGRAATMLGSVYWHGHGPVAQDQAAGLQWYRHAAEAGEPHALLICGIMLLDGKHVSQDTQKGLACLRLAAGQDHLPAIAELINRLRNAPDATPEMEAEAEAWQKRMDQLQGWH